MSNIRQAFQNGKAFIPFITCGDPDLESTKRNVRAAVADGVIVGSAIVRIMAEKGREADEEIARYVREMKTAANTFQ